MTISVEASVLSNCRIESNIIEKSIRQRESNRIESNYFSPNRNALPVSVKLRRDPWVGLSTPTVVVAHREIHLNDGERRLYDIVWRVRLDDGHRDGDRHRNTSLVAGVV